MVIAIVTAGGSGTRMHTDVPKQFLEINGKPLIAYSLEVFQNSEAVDAICLIYKSDSKYIFDQIISRFNLSKIKWMAPGGDTNELSIWNGLNAIKDDVSDNDIVLVHDGIRPLVTDEVIKDCILKTKEHGNAIAATPSNEAMLYSENGQSSKESLNRDYVKKTQTPHGMHFKGMYSLVKRMIDRGIINSTAICTMLIEDGQTVYFSKGENTNFKITTPEDLTLFKAMLLAKEQEN